MRSTSRFIAASSALLLLAMTIAGAAHAGDQKAKEAGAEMEWGYKAARRGYWQEALTRFQHANELTPDQPRILNNVAVALEANGRYEEALLAYQTGLAVAPNNDALRRNYRRFWEFYTEYVAPPEETPKEEEGSDDANQDS